MAKLMQVIANLATCADFHHGATIGSLDYFSNIFLRWFKFDPNLNMNQVTFDPNSYLYILRTFLTFTRIFFSIRNIEK